MSSYRLALLGRNISHSKSEDVYKKILKDVEYEYIDMPIFPAQEEIKTRLSNLDGLSITAPYKKNMYSLIKNKEELLSLESVNCIKLEDEELYGTNTDYLACLEILKNYKEYIEHICILGDGAMSKVLLLCCSELGFSCSVFARAKGNLDGFKEKLDKKTLIINSCARELDLRVFEFEDSSIWDLNYDQVYTKELVGKYGGAFCSGDELLELQAKFAVSFWNLKGT